MEFGGLLNFAAIGAALGFVASAWSKIKDVFHRIVGLFIISVEVDDNLSEYFRGYLMANCARWGNFERNYTSCWDFVRTKRRWGSIASERFGWTNMILWRGWSPIYFSVSKPQAPTAKGGGDSPGTPPAEFAFKLHFLRYTIDIDKMAADAAEWHNNMQWKISDSIADATHTGLVYSAQRFFVKRVPESKGNNHSSGKYNNLSIWRSGNYRPIGRNIDEIGWKMPEDQKALDRLIFPPHVVEILNEVKRWSQSRDWYIRRNIPWKKGLLMFGQPGTGKSVLAKSFAQDLDMPLFVYDLSMLDNARLVEEWRVMRAYSPCIALIEDFDGVFHGRENISKRDFGSMFSMLPRRMQKKESPFTNTADPNEKEDYRSHGLLTFDCLLNVLDGVDDNEGVFTIITTNKIEHIDEAIGRPVEVDGKMKFISSRPGRIDKAIELTYMTNECKAEMARRIFIGLPDALEEMLTWIKENPDAKQTPAQWQEACAELALARFWSGKDAQPAATV